MAYIRKRGNQLALVHGRRNAEGGKVEQVILFTLYSKEEALAAVGEDVRGTSLSFQKLLEGAYPEIRFDWKTIRKEILRNLSILPKTYRYRETEHVSRFREDLVAFARQILLADPKDFPPAGEALKRHRRHVEALRNLISWRLFRLGEKPPSKSSNGDLFQWRCAVRTQEVPLDCQEYAAGIFEKGDLDGAEGAFSLLVECFPGYAEGQNYLGVIALKRGALDEAVFHFREAVERGRRLFPKRLPRGRPWGKLEARPFVRGLRNLSLALIRSGRFDEALASSDRLEKECGDGFYAASYRASVFLNTRRFNEAAEAALRLNEDSPEESFVAALALFELGQKQEALVWFLHGAFNYPRTARALAGIRLVPPKIQDDTRDDEVWGDLQQTIGIYLKRRNATLEPFLQRVVRHPRVSGLLETGRKAKGEHRGDHETNGRSAEIRSPEFARKTAEELADLLG